MSAVLVLEDGRAFRGDAYGAIGETVGEAVFATGMTGYQETLTDPSYHRQIVVQTAPHIGNTGVNDEDSESGRIWVAGYVVRDPARRPSSWRARRSLGEELDKYGIVGISGIDTRALTKHLRDRGAMRAGISSVERDVARVLERVRSSPTMLGADLAREVSPAEAYRVAAVGPVRFRVVAVDLGMKAMIPRLMAERGIEAEVVPATTSAADILARSPDGVFVSNGPGDPAASDYLVSAMRGLLDAGLPVFGICLGHQILARALGFSTCKLRYGHRGLNLPVLDAATGKVEVTAHNHGFAVTWPAPEEGHRVSGALKHGALPRQADPKRDLFRIIGARFVTVETTFGRVAASHICLNDGVIEGMRCLDRPAFSVQYHPEAAAGPHDAAHLFDRFADLMGSVRPVTMSAW
jgi:carbamoyl-phosphate synthase small subunit